MGRDGDRFAHQRAPAEGGFHGCCHNRPWALLRGETVLGALLWSDAWLAAARPVTRLLGGSGRRGSRPNIEGHALCQSGQRCRGEGREAQAASDLGAPLWRMCYGRHSTCDWPGSDCTHSHEGGGHCCGCCRVSGDTPQRGSGPVCCLGGDLEEAGEANQRATSSGRAETAWA